MPTTIRTPFDALQIRDVISALATQPPEALPDEDLGLTTAVPIALLPVRLEAVFDPQGSTTLKVRVIPDDIHVAPLRRPLTAREAELGAAFWASPAPGDTASWTRLVQACGAGASATLRAAWIARSTRDGAPQVAERAPPLTAAALPDRWFVGAWRNGNLAASAISEQVQPELAVDPTRNGADIAWLRSFDTAKQAGMAVVLELPEAAVDVLLAVGVRRGAEPAAAAAELESLLEAQSFSRGLDLLAAGTPTNNTPATKAAWRSAPDSEVIRRREFGDAPAGDEGSNASVTGTLLGLNGSRTLHETQGAGRTDQVHAKAMMDVLWPITGGELLATMLSDRRMGGGVGVPPRVQEFARDHASRFVRGQGPMPTLLVGRQPYGILPASSTLRWSPGADGDLLAGLHERIRNGWALWEDDMAQVPRVGALEDPTQATELVARILGTSPVPDPTGYLARTVLPPNFSRTLPYIPIEGPLDADLATAILQVGWMPLINDTREASGRPAHVVLPAVADGIGERLAQLRSSDGVNMSPVARVPDAAVDLLTQLAQRALVRSADRAATNVGTQIATLNDKVEIASILPKRLVTDLGDVAFTATEALTLSDVGVTSDVVPADTTLAVAWRDEAIISALGLGDSVRSPEHTATLDGLAVLSGLEIDELTRLLGETLDVFSNRYDSWVTSLATRRLSEMRSATPQGIHLGGFGWLVDLRAASPIDPAAGRARTLHAPSTAHASTAAILRHSDLDDRAATLAQDGTARRFDLSADSVSRGRGVLDAVRNGQPLAAILGYRIERLLQDTGNAPSIPEFRDAFPLVGGEPPDPNQPTGSVPAHDVVDGVALWRALTENDSIPASISDEVRGIVLTELEFTVDALSDLLVAEGVHQLVRGDHARAAASVTALGRGEPPPADLHIVEPVGRELGVPVLLALTARGSEPQGDAGWASNRARARLAPTAERIARAVLPAAGDCVFQVQAGNELTAVELADLDLCALDVITEIGAGDDQSPLAARVLAHAGVAGTILDQPPHPSRTGWAALAAVARHWAVVLAAARPLLAADLALEPKPGELRPAPDTDAVDELHDTVTDEIERLRKAAAESVEPLARLEHPHHDDEQTLRAALKVFQRAGIGGSMPLIGESDATAVARCVPRVRGAIARFDALNETATAPAEGLDRAPRSAGDVSERIGQLCAFVREVFGSPVTVALPAAFPDPEANPDRDLSSSGELLDWMGELSEVRQPVRAWLRATLASQAATGRNPTLVASQFPRAPDEGWIGGWSGAAPEQPWSPPLSARHALVLHALDEAEVTDTITGLVVASWVEHVPLGLEAIVDKRHLPDAKRLEATGIAINLNAPDARPPQSILLAVPPDRAAPTWHLADVLATVLEALELTRFRLLEPPSDLPSRSFLPAIFVPEGIEGLSLGLRLREIVGAIVAEESTKHWRSFGDA